MKTEDFRMLASDVAGYRVRDWDRAEPTTPCSCSQCGWTGPAADLREVGACSLTVGDPSPAGRCPDADCDALCYAPSPIDRLCAMVAAPLNRWAVIIWPEWYDDADDTGYGWTGEAKDEADAVAQACRECDAEHIEFAASWGGEEWDVTDHVLDNWSVGTLRKHFGPKDWTNHAPAPTPEQLDGLRQAETAPAAVKAWAGPLPVTLENAGDYLPTDPEEVKVIEAGPDWRAAYEALAAAIKAAA